MLVFDIETTDRRDSGACLSFAAIKIDTEADLNWNNLIQSAFFAKLDLSEQKAMGRTSGASTLAWWEKQGEQVKRLSLIPSKSQDVAFRTAHERYTSWLNSVGCSNLNKIFIWTRGNLDGAIFSDLCEQFGVADLTPYNRLRDVRTAVDLLYGSTNGYCDVNPIIMPKSTLVMKHNPIHDCALDAMMLRHGIQA